MLKLLVLQPTPFCNIACDYCYLPDRGERGRMSLGVLAQALKRVADSGWLGPTLDVAWHAGEPLVVPVDYYAAALELFRQCLPATVAVRHGIQTNATLIDPDWCRFFVEHRIDVGVSLDGPADLHDAHRRTRAGRGTHAAVLRGVRLLQAHGVPFHVICVLTDAALAQPDAVIDFFLGEGIGRIGFNIEELDGANRHSSIQGTAAERAYRRFMTRVLQRVRTEPERLQVRELTSVLEALAEPGLRHLRWQRPERAVRHPVDRLAGRDHDVLAGAARHRPPDLRQLHLRQRGDTRPCASGGRSMLSGNP